MGKERERERELFKSGAGYPKGRPYAGRRTQLPERAGRASLE